MARVGIPRTDVAHRQVQIRDGRLQRVCGQHALDKVFVLGTILQHMRAGTGVGQQPYKTAAKDLALTQHADAAAAIAHCGNAAVGVDVIERQLVGIVRQTRRVTERPDAGLACGFRGRLKLHRQTVQAIEQVVIAQLCNSAQPRGVGGVLIVDFQAAMQRQLVLHIQRQIDRTRLGAGFQNGCDGAIG